MIERFLNRRALKRLFLAGIAPVLFLASGVVSAELRIPPVYADQTPCRQLIDPDISISNKPMWVSIYDDGDWDNTLQELLREAFRKSGYEVVANEADSKAVVRIRIDVKVNDDGSTQAKRAGSGSLLGALIDAATHCVWMKKGPLWQLGQWGFKDESAYRALSARAANPMRQFQLKDTPIYGHMAVSSVPGGVYVLTDAVPAKKKATKNYFTEAVVHVTIASEGKSITAGRWYVASANHIPIVPLLERMFDDIFEPYGEDAPRIRFPKITAVPSSSSRTDTSE
ncbi:MAG: hypothetical protein FWH15_03735 [Betaproteobacteria bacterium]|nr:hypothetical protein [Betaproteobacteria bacterium]